MTPATTRTTRIGTEVRKLLGEATFFAAASCLVVLTEQLLVWDSNVTTATFTSAIVAGLVIAKVLPLVDLPGPRQGSGAGPVPRPLGRARTSRAGA